MIKSKRALCLTLYLYLLINLHKTALAYNSNSNHKHTYQSYANEYSFTDSRYFKHGSRQNENSGGTCSEFLRINLLNKCCNQRDDECYMIHYDTRCYCDVFCDRSMLQDNSDCCDDAIKTCSSSGPSQETTTRPTSNFIFLHFKACVFTFANLISNVQAPSNRCYHEGAFYEDGQSFQDNCNEW